MQIRKPFLEADECLDFPDFWHRDFLAQYLACHRLSIGYSSGNPVLQRYATPIFIAQSSHKFGMKRGLEAKRVLQWH